MKATSRPDSQTDKPWSLNDVSKQPCAGCCVEQFFATSRAVRYTQQQPLWFSNDDDSGLDLILCITVGVCSLLAAPVLYHEPRSPVGADCDILVMCALALARLRCNLGSCVWLIATSYLPYYHILKVILKLPICKEKRTNWRRICLSALCRTVGWRSHTPTDQPTRGGMHATTKFIVVFSGPSGLISMMTSVTFNFPHARGRRASEPNTWVMLCLSTPSPWPRLAF